MHHGLTPKEARVMALWDRNFGMAAIAAETGLPYKRVQRIISTYHDPGEHSEACAAVGNACNALAAAILKARTA